MNAITLKRTLMLRTFLCGLPLLVAACSGEQDSPAFLPGGDPVPLSVGTVRLTDAPATRAGDESGTTVNADGAKLRLFRTAAGGYEPMYDVACTYTTAGGGQWTSEHPIYVDSRKATVYACYDPNNVVTFGANSTETSSTISLGDYDADKMWYFDNAHTTVSCTDAEPDFTLTCVYARMLFHIARNADYPNACKISKISIQPTTGNFTDAARFDLSTGKLTDGSNLGKYDKDTKSLPMYTAGVSGTTPDTSVELMVPAQPMPAGASLKIALTVDGVDCTATLTPAQFSRFAGSVRYTVYLNIMAKGLVVQSVSLTDWTDKSTDVGSSFD